MLIRCGIMALVAAYLNFLSQMIANPPFCQHVSKVRGVNVPPPPHPSPLPRGCTCSTPFSRQVIELRSLDAPYLLPEHVFRDKCP